MKWFRLWLVVVALTFLVPRLCFAQVVLMPVTGHGDTTMSYAELYDDGGSTQPYSQQCNATYTFHTVHPQGRYIIDVESQLTHPQGNAWLQITNGTSVYGQSICTFPYGNTGHFLSNSNTVTIGFVSDDDMPTDGFKVILCEYINAVAGGILGEFVDSNTYILTWGGGDSMTVWTVEYAVLDHSVAYEDFFSDSTNFTTLYLDSGSLIVQNIPVGWFVVYHIYTPQGDAPCMREVYGQSDTYQEPFECPCVKPDAIQIDTLADSLHISWTWGGSAVSQWHIMYPTILLDTILDGSVMEITIPYEYTCNGDVLLINGNCNMGCNWESVILPSGGCHQTVGGLRCERTTGTTVTLSWNSVEDSNARILIYYKKDTDPSAALILYDTLPTTSTGVTIGGLEPVTSYYFKAHVLCSDGTMSCYSSNAVFNTTLDNCIDYVNIYDEENVHLTWGVYSDPMRNTSGPSGRHVPMTDTTAHDPNTGDALRCVPSGELASFRLGDANIGALAETVTYDYEVDSLDKDMLVLKYAVVLQNSNHNSSNQPHFTMEILDGSGMVVDTTCCYADFYAAGELGWNSVAGSNVIWKDWTTVGIDIARYHGQRIKIRFTTKDCSDGGHYGYAYLVLGCDSKRIALVNLCETLDSVRLRVPLGFEYHWTHGEDTTCISVENEIIVPADSSVYHCHATFVGKPECGFDVHSLAVLPQPKADMEVRIDTCNNKVYLVGRCRVDIDSTLLPYVRQTIDSVRWEMNGVTQWGDTAMFPVEGNGVYTAKLFCKLSGSMCVDSMETSVVVNFVHSTSILGDTVACYGDSVLIVGHVSPFDEVAVAWDNALRDTSRTVVVSSDTLLTFYVNYYQCYDTLYHYIAVKPHYDDTVTAAFCRGSCDTLGFTEESTGLYTHQAVSIYGCDSMMTLDLAIFPTYYDTVHYASCDEPFVDNEFQEDSTGFYIHYYTTMDGCDSVYSLDFVRHPIFVDTVVEEILWGDHYDENGFSEYVEGFYEHIYTDANGCDSIWRLDLHVVNLLFPNVVTPNGDGYNDVLEIVGLKEATMFDYSVLWVFDRWGRRIFKAENMREMSDFWNPAKTNTPEGTYFYRFYAHSKKHEINYKGAVEVISGN